MKGEFDAFIWEHVSGNIANPDPATGQADETSGMTFSSGPTLSASCTRSCRADRDLPAGGDLIPH